MIESHPRTKEDVLEALANLGARDLKFWLDMAPERFARPFGEAWSPADTVRHLTKSTVPVTRALKLPALALRALFGKGRGTSMPYPDLVERYRRVLASGGTAGKFAPAPCPPPPDLGSWQQDLIWRCQSAVEALARVVDSWHDADLDRCQLPHPLLERLTAREMLFFTLYHYEHHRAIVARRLATS